MPQRFGGRYSPGGRPDAPTTAPTLAPPTPGRARVQILMALSVLPVIAAFFQDGPIAFGVSLGAAAALFAGAVATREGMKAEAAWLSRKVARRPAVPRKLFGAVLTGAGVMLGIMEGLSGLLGGLAYGVIAVALHVVSFGMDPMRDKGMEGIDTHQSDRVARSIEEAEGHLTAMQDAVRRAKDREAESRVARVAQRAREMFRTIEEDPRDLSAARRFLSVYLLGARDATAKFADLYAQTRDATVKAEYLSLLDDLERGMEAKRETLLITDRTDLDVEIEVLRDRLKRDGLLVQE
jgi:hypothetical protein